MRAKYAAWGVCVGCLIMFALLAWQVRNTDSVMVQFDEAVAARAQEHAQTHPAVLAFARVFTHVGGITWMIGLAVLGALFLIWLRHPKLAVVWLLLTFGGAGLNQGGKAIYHRSRPDEQLRDEAVVERTASFPSGHAMGSIIGYGFVAYAGWVLLRPRWAKGGLVALMAVMLVVIGWTRVYLRAHWLSDVIAGWSLGLVWLSLWYALFASPTGRGLTERLRNELP